MWGRSLNFPRAGRTSVPISVEEVAEAQRDGSRGLGTARHGPGIVLPQGSWALQMRYCLDPSRVVPKPLASLRS